MSKKHTPVKNQRERESYHRDSRQQSKMNPTGDYGSPSLLGSGDTWEPDDNVSDGSKIPVDNPSVDAWLKEHWKEAIAVPLVLMLIGFIAKWVFTKNAEIAVIQNTLETIEDRIEKLETDTLTKEYFDLKIELVKKDLSALIPDISGLETQITDIETRLDAIEK